MPHDGPEDLRNPTSKNYVVRNHQYFVDVAVSVGDQRVVASSSSEPLVTR